MNVSWTESETGQRNPDCIVCDALGVGWIPQQIRLE
jgi:hypothetical protein